MEPDDLNELDRIYREAAYSLRVRESSAAASAWGQPAANPNSLSQTAIAEMMANMQRMQGNIDPGRDLINMIMSRLRGVTKMPFDTMVVREVQHQKFVCFIVNNGKHTTLEDGALFPSDQLITKIRLLMDEA